MSKNVSKKGRRSRFPSPLVIIGGTIIILTAGFLVVSEMILDSRTPAARRAVTEEAAERGAAVPFRNDALLTFADAEGNTVASVDVEIAESEEARTQGLMGRASMAEREGMLFIFPREEFRSFWMANTPLPLDIIFVNGEKRIVTIQRNTVPYSEDSVPSTAPARYVVEVNAGFADRHGLREGFSVDWLRN